MKLKLFISLLPTLYFLLPHCQKITIVPEKSQTTNTTKAGRRDPRTGLHINDTVPDVVFKYRFDTTIAIAHLSDYKGKLIILDFWGTGCPGCIAGFPKMEALQKKFEDSLKILLVNNESFDSTERFFAKHKKIKLPHLPLLMGDSILSELFPHLVQPHHIWISKDHVVSQITGRSNEDSIVAFLSGRQVSLYEKLDYPPVNVLINDSYYGENEPMLIFYSSLMKSIKETGRQDPEWIVDTSTGKNIGVHYDKSSITEIFRSIVLKTISPSQDSFDYNNRYVLNVKNPYKYMYFGKGEINQWRDENTYRFTFKVPISKSNQLFDFMKSDIERIFDVSCSLEKRNVECLALIRTSKIDKIRSNGGSSFFGYKDLDKYDGVYDRDDKDEFIVRNISAETLAKDIQWLYPNSEYPIVDASNYHGNIDIILNGQVRDLVNLKRQLARYDLDLVLMKRTLDMIVISEHGYQNKK
jgi:thiol-disulfide isomerase/thioredoxin